MRAQRTQTTCHVHGGRGVGGIRFGAVPSPVNEAHRE